MALYQIKPLQVVNSEGSVVGSRGSWVLKSGRLISAGLNKDMTLTRLSDLGFPSWMSIYFGPINSGLTPFQPEIDFTTKEDIDEDSDAVL